MDVMSGRGHNIGVLMGHRLLGLGVKIPDKFSRMNHLSAINADPNSILHLYWLNTIEKPPGTDVVYNSSLPVALLMNLFKMLVLLVNSSSFSGAKPPFLRMPSNLANSFAAYASLLLSLSNTLT